MSTSFESSRRSLLFGSVLLPALTRRAHAGLSDSAAAYTISVNIEIMFPKDMPRGKRMEAVAAHGMKAFSFWTVTENEEKEMLAVQKRTGLKCASIAGSGRIGWTTGLTKTGFETAYLDIITQNCEVAKRFGGPDLLRQLRGTPVIDLCISVITKSELLYRCRGFPAKAAGRDSGSRISQLRRSTGLPRQSVP